ncbi:MAG: fibronectin type III domain-containing protein [Thermoplasmata archaeon]|nr:fibronectin type III domain-containing protein [Thermoplasmata archaeon]
MRALGTAGVLALLLAAAVLFAPVLSEIAGSGPLGALRSSSQSIGTLLGATHALPATPRSFGAVGPIGPEYYLQSNSSFGAAFEEPLLAVDPLHQVLYAVDQFHGFLTASNLTTGALLASTVFAADPPAASQVLGLSFLPDHGQVVASYDWGPGGSLLVFNGSSLGLEQNLTAFPGLTGYPPAKSLYVRATDQLWVQDENHGGLEILSAEDLSLVSTLATTPGCSLGCASDGLVDISVHGFVLSDTGYLFLPEISLANDSAFATLPGPNGTFTFGKSAFDAVSNQIWAENFSGSRAIVFARFNASTGSFLGNVATPIVGFRGIAYDPRLGAMVLAERDPARCLGNDLLWLNNTAGGVLTDLCGPGFPTGAIGSYSELALVDLPAASLLVAAAPGEAELFALARAGNSTLTRLFAYGEIAPTSATFFLPGGAETVEAGAGPNGTVLSLRSENTGATIWAETVRPVGPTAVDPSLGLLYLANVTGEILAYHLSDGSYAATVVPRSTNSVLGLAVDPVHAWLYAIEPANGSTTVSVYSLSGTSATLQGNLGLSGVRPCAWTADPAVPALALTSCLLPGAPSGNNLTLIDPSPLAAAPAIPTGEYPDALCAGASGNMYILDASSSEVTEWNASARATRNVAVTGFGASSLAVDSSGGLLLGAVGAALVILNLSAPGLPLVARLSAPSALASVGVDPASGVLLASTSWTGQGVLLSPASTPWVVPGFEVAPANDSLAASWGPARNPLGAVAATYLLSLSNDSGRTWNLAGQTTALNLTLTGLVDGRNYLVQLAAKNSAGGGPPSANLNASPVGAPYPPTELRATANSSLVALAWQPPVDDDGAPITGYVVQWRASSTGAWTSAPTGSGLSYNATNLSDGNTYSFRVLAVNRAGTGNPSAGVSIPFGPAGSVAGPLSSAVTQLALVLLVVAIAIIALVLLVRRHRGPEPPGDEVEPQDAEFRVVPSSSAPIEPSTDPPAEAP